MEISNSPWFPLRLERMNHEFDLKLPDRPVNGPVAELRSALSVQYAACARDRSVDRQVR